MPISWIEYKGKKILYADYRNLKSEDLMLANLDEELKFYEKTNGKILSLNDYRDTYISKEFMNKVTEAGKKFKGIHEKSAILGITGIKKILLNSYSVLTGDPTRSFDEEEKAKEYLAS